MASPSEPSLAHLNGGYAIDKCYKIVQTILNENHYGTLSPARFNLLAFYAQQSIFSEAINFIKKTKMKDSRRRADKDFLKLYQEALAGLYIRDKELTEETEDVFGETRIVYLKENDIAYVDSVICLNSDGSIREAEVVHINSDIGLTGHLMSPTEAFPIAIDKRDKYEVLPDTISSVYLYYYRYPKAPKWTYINSNNQPVFSVTDNLQDFELGVELLDDIILHILQMAGVHLKRADVVQYTENEEAYKDKQELQ